MQLTDSKPLFCPAYPSKKPLVGIFDGRSPCQELARLIQEKATPECNRIKWRLALYKDSVTGKPDGYQLWGLIYRNEHPREGQWQIIRGTKADPDAIVYQLDLEGKPSMFLQQGDENVLFFLDAEKDLFVGNRDFSYTLNRVSKADELRIMSRAK